jgi:hypothetical protein
LTCSNELAYCNKSLGTTWNNHTINNIFGFHFIKIMTSLDILPTSSHVVNNFNWCLILFWIHNHIRHCILHNELFQKLLHGQSLIVKAFHACHLMQEWCNMTCKFRCQPFYVTSVSRITICKDLLTLGSHFSFGSPRLALSIPCHQPLCGLCFQGFPSALSIFLLNLLIPHKKHQQITTLDHKQTHAYAKRPTPKLLY